MSENLMSLARSGGKFLKLFGDRKMMKRLPYDAEVEYLESTGTQWIDTEIIPKSDYGFEIKFMKLDMKETVPLGTWGGWLVKMFGGDFKYTDNVFLGTFGSSNIEILYNKINNIIIEKLHHKRLTVECNGVLDYDNVFTENFACTYSAYLFGNNIAGSARHLGPCRIFMAQITDGNDFFVRDFIPVKFTNESGETEGAMYDRIGVGGMNPDGSPREDGLYRNRGTGAFIIGPDKTI